MNKENDKTRYIYTFILNKLRRKSYHQLCGLSSAVSSANVYCAIRVTHATVYLSWE